MLASIAASSRSCAGLSDAASARPPSPFSPMRLHLTVAVPLVDDELVRLDAAADQRLAESPRGVDDHSCSAPLTGLTVNATPAATRMDHALDQQRHLDRRRSAAPGRGDTRAPAPIGTTRGRSIGGGQTLAAHVEHASRECRRTTRRRRPRQCPTSARRTTCRPASYRTTDAGERREVPASVAVEARRGRPGPESRPASGARSWPPWRPPAPARPA